MIRGGGGAMVAAPGTFRINVPLVRAVTRLDRRDQRSNTSFLVTPPPSPCTRAR